MNGTSNYGIWYSFDTNASLVGFSDADCAGNCDDRKSTSGGCFFLGNNLVSWFCKKQNSISLSTAEAEYIAAGSGCTQLLWMKQMLVDYRFNQGTLTLFCDNMSAINISKNPIQHSRTKHIDIRHHFIRELVENKCIVLEHVGTNDQLADLFTKPLDATRFKTLSRSIGICLVEWCVLWLTPYGELKQRELFCILVTCKKFEITYASSFNCLSKLGCTYVYMFSNSISVNLAYLQSMSYVGSNMHLWTRRFT